MHGQLKLKQMITFVFFCFLKKRHSGAEIFGGLILTMNCVHDFLFTLFLLRAFLGQNFEYTEMYRTCEVKFFYHLYWVLHNLIASNG